jgi:hypothetical protein
MMDPENDTIDTVVDDTLDTTLETAPVEVVETDKPEPTMEDTLRDTYRKLTADPEKAAPDAKAPVEAKPAVAAEVKPGEQPRGPDGKFAPKDAAAPVDPNAPVIAPPVEEKPAVAADPSTAKAPSSWGAEAQAEYAKLPPAVQAQVHKREADFHNGLKAYKQKSETFDVLHKEIMPYEAMIRASGQTAQAVVASFFNTAYQLKTASPEGKAEILMGIAKEYGVDTSLLPFVEERIAAGQPVVDPNYRALEQKFNQLQETIAQRETREAQEREQAQRAEAEAIAAETNQWSQGKEHYQAVRLTMAALMESGQAKTLDEAYEKACWAIPDVRAKQLAQQQATARVQAAEKAAAAKKASSTNVAPRGTPPAAKTKVMGTMEDTIRARLKELSAA